MPAAAAAVQWKQAGPGFGTYIARGRGVGEQKVANTNSRYHNALARQQATMPNKQQKRLYTGYIIGGQIGHCGVDVVDKSA